MGKRAERNRLVEGLGKRLQAGHVGRERKLAIADGERRFGIELLDDRIVPRDQGPAVDRLARIERQTAEAAISTAAAPAQLEHRLSPWSHG